MSTSLLYHGFGIRGYEYVRSYYEGGGIIFKIRQQRNELRCSCCGSPDVIRRGQVERLFKCLPIGLKPVSILLAIQRVCCLTCGVVRQVKIALADQRRSYTRGFERYALELLRHMTIQDVGKKGTLVTFDSYWKERPFKSFKSFKSLKPLKPLKPCRPSKP